MRLCPSGTPLELTVHVRCDLWGELPFRELLSWVIYRVIDTPGFLNPIKLPFRELLRG